MNKFQNADLRRTFSEKRSRIVFDWLSALKTVTPDNTNLLVNMREKSANWVTCACGNQCAIIPRCQGNGEPEDEILRDLGNKFYNRCNNLLFSLPEEFEDYRNQALSLLAEIERRAFHLINEEVFRIEVQNLFIKPLLREEAKKQKPLIL